MNSKHAREIALNDIVDLLGAANSGLRGICPRFEGSRFLSDDDKKKIRREWMLIEFGLVNRLEKLRG